MHVHVSGIVILLLIRISVQLNAQIYTLQPHRFPEISQPGETLKKDEDSMRYLIVEHMPLFPGCIDTDLTNDQKYKCSQRKLQGYISSNLQYPNEALKQGIDGHVVVEFVVEPDGHITQIKTINDIGGGCAEEAVRIIESMNYLNERWAPALQRGKPVRVMQKVAVSFEIPISKQKTLHE